MSSQSRAFPAEFGQSKHMFAVDERTNNSFMPGSAMMPFGIVGCSRRVLVVWEDRIFFSLLSTRPWFLDGARG